MNKSSGSRFLGLDLLRFLAAVIVFLGHLIFNVKSEESKNSILEFLLGPLHTGRYAVLFFFALSGFVLAKQNFRGIQIRVWILSRWVRLMPVFYVTYFSGLALLVVGKGFVPNLKNTLIEITGLSSLTFIGVPAPNPPLWSLSVELLLSLLLPLLVRIRRNSILVFILAISLLAQHTVIGGFSIVSAFPHFIAGVIASKIFGNKREEKVIFNYLVLGFLAAFCVLSPLLITGPTTILGNLLSILAISFLIVCGSRVLVPNGLSSISRIISLRSYSLYAAHWPIVKSVEEFTNPNSVMSWSIYILASLFSVLVGTEILYQLVEKPALSTSKRLKIRNQT